MPIYIDPAIFSRGTNIIANLSAFKGIFILNPGNSCYFSENSSASVINKSSWLGGVVLLQVKFSKLVKAK